MLTVHVGLHFLLLFCLRRSLSFAIHSISFRSFLCLSGCLSVCLSVLKCHKETQPVLYPTHSASSPCQRAHAPVSRPRLRPHISSAWPVIHPDPRRPLFPPANLPACYCALSRPRSPGIHFYGTSSAARWSFIRNSRSRDWEAVGSVGCVGSGTNIQKAVQLRPLPPSFPISFLNNFEAPAGTSRCVLYTS